MKCFTNYNWANPSALLQVGGPEFPALLDTLVTAQAPGVVPVVRVPLTASSWLGAPTKASAGNAAKYPQLGAQYRSFVQQLIGNYTARGIVAIADLHWTDDDSEQQAMAGIGKTGNATAFWDSVAATFGSNPLVFYELYNEPHTTDMNLYLHGGPANAGMLQMLAAVRAHTQNPCVIAGAQAYAYDADSLIQLDQALKSTTGERNVLYNFHPYMGPDQAGAQNKCASGFDLMVQSVRNATDKPLIITEFGQACCATNGPCMSCGPTGSVGYDEAIIQICQKYAVSWLPWAWRPGTLGPNTNTCQDINSAVGANGTAIGHAANGKGADFADLWAKYANVAPNPPPPGPPTPTPTPPPTPSPPSPSPSPPSPTPGGSCTGGSLLACMDGCPSSPPSAFKACEASCAANCPAPGACTGGTMATCMHACPSDPPSAFQTCEAACAQSCPHTVDSRYI